MIEGILVILGHPDSESFCSALMQAYIDGASKTGAEIRALKLGELSFDLVLWHGYQKIQALEPDHLRARELIEWAENAILAPKYQCALAKQRVRISRLITGSGQ